MTLAKLIATVLGVGYIRPASGTWGSLVALPWAWLLHGIGGELLVIQANHSETLHAGASASGRAAPRSAQSTVREQVVGASVDVTTRQSATMVQRTCQSRA